MRIRIMGCFFCLLLRLVVNASTQIPLEKVLGRVAVVSQGDFRGLVEQTDMSRHKVTWCGRFALPFGIDFAIQLARMKENRDLTGFFLRSGSSLSDPWLPLKKYGLGVTSKTDFHHFVTYFSIGFS